MKNMHLCSDTCTCLQPSNFFYFEYKSTDRLKNVLFKSVFLAKKKKTMKKWTTANKIKNII